ncbi:MAG: glycoside hydrolase family 99-like domain-containing protein [Bacteroidaceae bacterium]|nr:glycoside hydrolase family 99-like domain-containing protein [Bacteroidaceae bacterium]
MKVRIIAYYLPQFHPIPENDAAWGPGFTEWTNVAQARPLFRGHYQPRIPADLGFYDLRLPEVREQQAALAREAGIEGFCYWHYWFGNGKMLLERPFEEVLKSGKPDFPFCLAWANHDWTTGTWQKGGSNRMIAKQEYPGEEDYKAHFDYVLPAFRDHRYITVDGKPLFVIYDPYKFADVTRFMSLWQDLAVANGLPGVYFAAQTNNTSTIRRRENGSIERVLPNLNSSANVYQPFLDLGFNGIISNGKPRGEMLYLGKYRKIFLKLLHKYCPFLPASRWDYPKVVQHFFAPEDAWENVFPIVMPQWDRTARTGKSEGIYVNATPEAFRHHVEQALNVVKEKQPDHRIVILRSWNEWAEGNYMEPDLRFGHGFIDALKGAIKDFSS